MTIIKTVFALKFPQMVFLQTLAYVDIDFKFSPPKNKFTLPAKNNLFHNEQVRNVAFNRFLNGKLHHSLATLEGEQDLIEYSDVSSLFLSIFGGCVSRTPLSCRKLSFMKNYGITLIRGNYETMGRQIILYTKTFLFSQK